MDWESFVLGGAVVGGVFVVLGAVVAYSVIQSFWNRL